MKKITLHDIMESLTNDDIKNAQTSLHEWFVERSRQIHSQLTGSDTNESVINENEDDVIFDALDGVAGLIANGEQEGVTEVDLGDNLADLYWKSVAYDPNANLKDGSFKSEIEELKAKAGGNVFDHGYFTEQGDQVGIVYVVTMSGMDESVFTEDGGTEEWFVNLNVSTTDERTGYSLRDQLRNNSSIGREDELGISDTNLVMGWYVDSEDEANQLALTIRGLNIENSKVDISHRPLGESGISESDETVDTSPGQQEAWIKGLSEFVQGKLDFKAEVEEEGDEFDEEFELETGQNALAKAQAGDLQGAYEEVMLLDTMFADDMFDTLNNAGVNLKALGITMLNQESRISESEDDYNDLVAELKEAFAGLEAVSDKLQNVEGAQVGEEGKVPVNKKSTLPSHKGDKRVGGAPVAIKSKDHNGHALEKSPKVTDVKTKGNVQNSKDDPKKVAAPKGALLNKMDGSVNTQSPISGKGAKGLKK